MYCNIHLTTGSHVHLTLTSNFVNSSVSASKSDAATSSDSFDGLAMSSPANSRFTYFKDPRSMRGSTKLVKLLPYLLAHVDSSAPLETH